MKLNYKPKPQRDNGTETVGGGQEDKMLAGREGKGEHKDHPQEPSEGALAQHAPGHLGSVPSTEKQINQTVSNC